MNFFPVAVFLAVVLNAGDKRPADSCPEVSSTNVYATDCREIPEQWKRIKEMKDPAKIGYFVRYLYIDLNRCPGVKLSDIGETEESLKKYSHAYFKKAAADRRIRRESSVKKKEVKK